MALTTLNKEKHLWPNVHLLVLWNFFVAQPVFGLLGPALPFFQARHSDNIDLLLFSTSIALVLPVLLILAKEVLCAVIRTPVFRNLLQRILITILFSLLLLQFLHAATLPGGILVAGAVLVGYTLALLVENKKGLSGFISFLWPVVIAIPVVFLFFSPVSTLMLPSKAESISPTTQGTKNNPIVFVIFDELPISSLLNTNGKIDATLYPNFARLANTSTWHQNTFAAADSTAEAVPAILGGMSPTPNRVMRGEDLHNNLFTLFGLSHRMHVSESRTNLCPVTLCKSKKQRLPELFSALKDAYYVYLHILLPEDLKEGLPSVSEDWGGFDNANEKNEGVGIEKVNSMTKHRAQQFIDYVEQIKPEGPDKKPSFHFIHTVLPHAMYNYLPGGKYYSVGFSGPRSTPFWETQDRRILLDYQRHLLQVSASDYLLGQLLDKLAETGLMENALIIVTADHGASWRYHCSRRSIQPCNPDDILPVPLFIKLPQQKIARVETRNVRSIDILPTLAQLMQASISWPIDGESVLAEKHKPATSIDVYRHNKETPLTFPIGPERIQASLKRKHELFGPINTESLYNIGPDFNRAFYGKPLSEFNIGPASGYQFSLKHPEDYQNVKPNGEFIPSMIEANLFLDDPKSTPPEELLIAVNDVIAGTYPVVEQDKKGRWHFYSMVKESFLHAGTNNIRVFVPSTPGQLGEIPYAQ